MNRKHTVEFLALALAVSAASLRAADARAPFDKRERAVLMAVADNASTALKAAGLPTGIPLSALRIVGDDRDDWLLGQLKIAATKAGLNYVEGRTDPMWDAIVAEIEWDEFKGDMLDEQTLTKFGRLQAARLLLYGRLILERYDDGRPYAEVTLHISSTETKQHIWGDTFLHGEPAPEPEPEPVFEKELTFVNNPIALVDAPVHVFVETAAADGETLSRKFAAALATEANGSLAQHGYAVCPSAAEAEVVVSIRAAAPVFHRERSYVSLDGTAALLATRRVDNHILGQADISAARTKLVMGDDTALADLRRSIAPEFLQWLSTVTNPEKVGMHVTSLIVDFATPSSPELEQLVVTLRSAVQELNGVRDVRLVSTLPLPDGKPGSRVTLRVSYFPADLPDGLVASLAAKRPDLFRRTVQVPAK